MSAYHLWTPRGTRTLNRVEDGCDRLFCALELEKRTSYDPMHESVVLIRGDPRPHTQPWCVHQLLRFRPPIVYVATSNMFRNVRGSMGVEYFILCSGNTSTCGESDRNRQVSFISSARICQFAEFAAWTEYCTRVLGRNPVRCGYTG